MYGEGVGVGGSAELLISNWIVYILSFCVSHYTDIIAKLITFSSEIKCIFSLFVWLSLQKMDESDVVVDQGNYHSLREADENEISGENHIACFFQSI